MKKIHTKSPCCRTLVWQHGDRRRRCSACGSTWRAWKVKRGRKRKRAAKTTLVKYLRHELPSLYAMARASKRGEGALKNKLRRSLDFFLAHTPWPTLPQEGRLILVADAFVKQVEGGWHTAYLMLLQEVDGTHATIAPPHIIGGTETGEGWKEALSMLPEPIKARIQALVSDGHSGLVWCARTNGWVVQRCHFHLIARLQSRRSKWGHSQHRAEGIRIYRAVMKVLTEPQGETTPPFLTKIENLTRETTSPEIKRVLRGFIRNYGDYRAYLRYPELRLPTTNNSAESLVGLVKNLMHRARGFRTRASLEKWVSALIKERKTILCNGNSPPN